MTFTKVCRTCNQEKNTTEFYKHKNTKDRLRSECKTCWKELCSKSHHKNRDARRDRLKRFYYKAKYNITPEEADEIKKKQNFQCEICEEVDTLVIDHNHVNGDIRGALCNRCNQGIGLLRENPKYLISAINYLRKYNH